MAGLDQPDAGRPLEGHDQDRYAIGVDDKSATAINFVADVFRRHTISAVNFHGVREENAGPGKNVFIRPFEPDKKKAASINAAGGKQMN